MVLLPSRCEEGLKENTHVDQAYWGDGFGNGPFSGWNGGLRGGYRYESGYQAGISDAQNDYQSNLVYSPHPSYCCHSPEWTCGFEAGYNYQLNLQEQTQVTKQAANVYVENSPGTQVNIAAAIKVRMVMDQEVAADLDKSKRSNSHRSHYI